MEIKFGDKTINSSDVNKWKGKVEGIDVRVSNWDKNEWQITGPNLKTYSFSMKENSKIKNPEQIVKHFLKYKNLNDLVK